MINIMENSFLLNNLFHLWHIEQSSKKKKKAKHLILFLLQVITRKRIEVLIFVTNYTFI